MNLYQSTARGLRECRQARRQRLQQQQENTTEQKKRHRKSSLLARLLHWHI